MIYLKFISRLIRFFKSLLTNTQLSNHKFQNKNQVTNANIILNLLKNKNFSPNYIVDVGCGYGEWTKKLLNIFPKSDFYLYDADKNNFEKLAGKDFLKIAQFHNYSFNEIKNDTIELFGIISKPETDWSFVFNHYFDLNTKEFRIEEYNDDEI